MENSVKAMYMVAALLISVMILGLFIYLFRTGSLFGTNYELKKQQEQIDQFNAKFEVFARDSEKTIDGVYYTGNTIFDVITAANLAYDINEKNYNDNKNRVEVEVKGLSTDLCIGIILQGEEGEEENILRKNEFFKGNLSSINSSTERINMDNLLTDTSILRNNSDETNLKRLIDARLNLNNNDIPKNRTIYRYYFTCVNDDILYSQESGKVNKITFNLVENDDAKFRQLNESTEPT